MPAKTEKEEIQPQSHLTRTIIAALSNRHPSPKEKNFLICLIQKVIGDLPSMKPAFIIRIYEAASEVDFADEEIITLRESCQPHIAKWLDLPKFQRRP